MPPTIISHNAELPTVDSGRQLLNFINGQSDNVLYMHPIPN